MLFTMLLYFNIGSGTQQEYVSSVNKCYFGTRWIWEKSRDCRKEQGSLEDMPRKTALCWVFLNMSL